MRRDGTYGRWTVVLGVLGALGASRVSGAEEEGPRTILDERFDAPRVLLSVPTYERVPAEIAARVESGECWHLVLEPGSSATAEVADGTAVLHIERAGPNWYSVQLAYLGVGIRPEKAYRVTLRARAERKVVATFDLAHVGSGWRSYSGRKDLKLDRSWREHEVRFTTDRRDADESTRFEFNFGDERDNTIYVDDVRIVEEPLPSKG